MRRIKGFTLIELMIVIAIIAIIAAIAIPNLISARKHGNETAAIGALKTVSTSQELFKSGDKDGNNTPDYGTLQQLSSTQLIDQVLGSGNKQGYTFTVGASTTTATDLWFGTANPTAPTVSGDRYFEINQAGAIFYTTGASLAMNTSNCQIAAGTNPVGK